MGKGNQASYLVVRAISYKSSSYYNINQYPCP